MCYGLQPLGETLDVVFKCTERHVTELFSGSFADRPPQMRLFKRFEGEGVVPLADVETEFPVEIFCHGEVRHHEVKMIDRMNAEFAGPSGGAMNPWIAVIAYSLILYCGGHYRVRGRSNFLRFNCAENIFVN